MNLMMWYITIIAYGLFGIYHKFYELREHCTCGDEIPEGGGLCECGEYYHRMIIRREDELKRIKEERRKGNDYDTVL